MYTCAEPGCFRSFKRPEHLSRHRLNHQPRKIHQCLVCRKDFVRLDLLQRHMRRHDRGMAYRSSGGYSTSGRPGSTRRLGEEDELGSPSPAASITVSDVELRGQSSAIEDGATVVTHDPPAHEQVDVQPIVIHTLKSASLEGIQPASQISRPSDRSDVEHLTFFDGANDATGLTQDLDWLFGASPWDVSAELHDANIHAHISDFSETSPPSEGSHSSIASTYQLGSSHQVPRERVLLALASLPPEVTASSFFDTTNLERFMQSYWQNYNPHFSLLHKPSFSVQDAPPLLLVALLTLGATLSPEEEHYLVAEQIHQTLRWLIFTSPSFQAPAPLWVVQALLIVQAYEKMFSTRRLHEISHIFHYSVITLMRRGSFYSPDREDDGDMSSMEKVWHRWSERESSYRAAYFAFIMDAQHSSIFGHTAALSLTDIHLPLPCADSLWEAPTASAWNRERYNVQPVPLFLPALRTLLSRQPIPHTYSPFARFVLLHGLFSLTRHMITRDQTASCISVTDQQLTGLETGQLTTPEQDNWRDRLDRAIDTWSCSLLSQTPSLCLEAARPLQRIAHVSIHASLVDFHILAGAPNLATGVRAQRESVQFARARKRISEWAHHRNAKRTLSHCLLLIQETMFTRTRYLAAEDNIILRPWVLYNTTLVLWAYGVIRDGTKQVEDQTGSSIISPTWTAEEYLAHMLNGLMGDGDLSQLQGANRTAGLIAAVRNALEGCRWELLEEAKDTLSRISQSPDIMMSTAACHGANAQDEHQGS